MLRTAYVEMVTTVGEYRNQGIDSEVMKKVIQAAADERFDLAPPYVLEIHGSIIIWDGSTGEDRSTSEPMTCRQKKDPPWFLHLKSG